MVLLEEIEAKREKEAEAQSSGGSSPGRKNALANAGDGDSVTYSNDHADVDD